MRVNGKNVDNSNTEQLITDPSFTAVLVCQGVAELKRGDKVTVVFSGSEPGAGREKTGGRTGGAQHHLHRMEDRLTSTVTRCDQGAPRWRPVAPLMSSRRGDHDNFEVVEVPQPPTSGEGEDPSRNRCDLPQVRAISFHNKRASRP